MNRTYCDSVERQSTPAHKIIDSVGGGYNLHDVLDTNAKFTVFVVAGFVGEEHVDLKTCEEFFFKFLLDFLFN